MYEDAVDNFTQEVDFFIHYAPEAVAGAYHDRGLAYLEWGKYEQALEDLNRAIAESEYIDSSDIPPELFAERAVVLTYLGRAVEAERDI